MPATASSMARLLLAALLALAFEVVLWPQTPTRDAIDLAAALFGYLALAAALLDLIQRERVHNLIGLMALAGLAALAAGLLIHPRVALENAPLTIITRMLGAPTAAALAALLVWLALARGRLTLTLFVVALLAGATWGLYGRWFPSVLDPAAPETPLGTLLLATSVVLAVVALLAAGLRRAAPTPDALRLSAAGWTAVTLVLGGLLVLRLAQGLLDPLSLTIVAALMAFTGLILRLYRRKRDVTLIERALPPGPLHPTLLLAAAVFVAAGIATYGLPRLEGDADPLGLLGTLLIAFGVAWLPALSLVVGGRALIRQMRAQQL